MGRQVREVDLYCTMDSLYLPDKRCGLIGGVDLYCTVDSLIRDVAS